MAEVALQVAGGATGAVIGMLLFHPVIWALRQPPFLITLGIAIAGYAIWWLS